MVQKIIAARLRSGAPSPLLLAGEMVETQADQIVLARAPMRAIGEALDDGMKKASAEVAVAYDGCCVTGRQVGVEEANTVSAEMLARGVLYARSGIGFPGPVHLERTGRSPCGCRSVSKCCSQVACGPSCVRATWRWSCSAVVWRTSFAASKSCAALR
jgi:hypothetical protein